MSSHHSHHDHHAHHHGHGHVYDFGRAFAVGIALNLAFVAGEGLAGLIYGSMALVADAGHNLSDVLGLALAWGGAALARKQRSARFTYGLRGSTIVAALLNALLLLFACGAIALSAVQRLLMPHPVEGGAVAIVAAIGIVVNGATALLFARGRKSDINIRGAYLHMAADAAISAGVVLAGIAVIFTRAYWIDPAISLAIVAVIFWSTWGLLRDSLTLSVAGVPPGIDAAAVEADLRSAPGVERVHDFHIWPLSTTETALTAHLIMPRGGGDSFLEALAERLRHRFGIGHVTIQIERGNGGEPCPADGDCPSGLEPKER